MHSEWSGPFIFGYTAPGGNVRPRIWRFWWLFVWRYCLLYGPAGLRFYRWR